MKKRSRPTLISSQRFTDPEIIREKQDRRDYEVLLSPVFEIDGEEFQVILDGHHSFAAALADGVEPDFFTATSQDNDTILLLHRGEIDDFLQVNFMDSDWYDVRTGRNIW